MSSTRLDRISSCLEEIRKRNHGRLTARAVLAAARNKKHPLHAEFEWNDKIAGEKYRMDQARELIMSCEIVVTFSPVKLVCPAYVRDPNVPPRQQGHVAITSKDIALRDAVEILTAELVRISGNLQRARALSIFLANRFPAMPEKFQSMEAELDDMRSRLRV